jgi:hypothetical protein
MDLKSLGTVIVLLADDLFHMKMVIDEPSTSLCDALLFATKIESIQKQYMGIYTDKYIGGLDLYVNTANFHEHKVDKEYDILIYGNLEYTVPVHKNCLSAPDIQYFESWLERTGESEIPESYNFYPLRKRISDLLLANRDRYNIKHITSSNYCWNCEVKGEELSREIAKSYMALATSGRADKCMIKYTEIAASGTFLLGNIPTDFRDVFKDNIAVVREDMSDEEIFEVIDSYLADKKSLEERSKVFGQHIRDTYGGTRVVDDFIQHCQRILD